MSPTLFAQYEYEYEYEHQTPLKLKASTLISKLLFLIQRAEVEPEQ